LSDEVRTRSRTTEAARSRRWTLGIFYEVPIEWIAKELFYYSTQAAERGDSGIAGQESKPATLRAFIKKAESLTQKVSTVNI
jgi:hypothetical protein